MSDITPLVSLEGTTLEQRYAAIEAEKKTNLVARYVAPLNVFVDLGDAFRCQLGQLVVVPWIVTQRNNQGVSETIKGASQVFHLKACGKTFQKATEAFLTK